MKRLVLLTALCVPASVPAAPARGPEPRTEVTVNAAPRAPARTDGERCRRPDVHPARSGEPLRPKTLEELPPASLYLTVLRIENGCYEPVIVRRGIGALADPDGSRR